MIATALAGSVAVAAWAGRAGGPAAAPPAVTVAPAPSPARTPHPPGRTASATPAADPRPGTVAEQARPAPTAIEVPAHGPGTYRRARLDLAAPKGSGRVIRFDVRVERGLRLDPQAVAREIHRTLTDTRSWRTSDHVRFQLVADPDRARLHAYVATPGTTDRLCYPWRTRGALSCQTGNKVVLNAHRWVFGAKAYRSDVADYRRYLVNHEFGHALGYNHVGCPGKGRKAPVMMQQTKGLHGCRPNPWPTVAR